MSQAPTRTLVMKFGGSSVANTAAMRQVVENVRAAKKDWPRLVVVTSALSGITDLLIGSANHAALGDEGFYKSAEAQIRERHAQIAADLVGGADRSALLEQEIDLLASDFANRCQAVRVLGEITPRVMDSIAGMGERLAARVLAAALDSAGIPAVALDATQLIVTDDNFQSAHPDMNATRQRAQQGLLPVLERGQVAVATGFIAATPSGVMTTLGRGGSDYSAALLAAALPADELWIWTDVDGVMTADPRIVPDARTIQELSYREVAELAYYGAKVLHPKTIRPVIEAGIGLRVCNTFNPQHPGTRLIAGYSEPPEAPAAAGSPQPPKPNGKIKAVTAIRGLRLITIEGRGMLGVPGVAARTFSTVAATGTSVPLISQASSEQSICFAVPAEAAASVTAAMEQTFAREIASRDIDRVWATGEVVIVSVVGAGMISTPGIAGRVFQALGDVGCNVIAIAQGSSEVSISLIVDASETRTAVQALHKLIV